MVVLLQGNCGQGGSAQGPRQAYLEEGGHACPLQRFLQAEGEEHLSLSISEKIALLIWWGGEEEGRRSGVHLCTNCPIHTSQENLGVSPESPRIRPGKNQEEAQSTISCVPKPKL